MAKKSVAGRFLIAFGAVLILSALSLVLYNCYHENQSKIEMEKALSALEQVIPEEPPDQTDSSPFDVFDDEDEPVDSEETAADDTIELDGKIYIGMITFPTLDRQFPVINGWSYADMKIAPCRYAGTRAGRDLIICAHNYSGFFDSLDELSSGDEIIFTDIYGRDYRYYVSYTELINGWNVPAMFNGAKENWDLTLFTCTWSGYSRVTVRAVLAE